MTILLQVSALFILMTLGYAAGKLKMIDSPAIRGMSNLLVKACLPALILTSLQKPFSPALFGEAIRTLLVATVFYLVLILASIAATRLLRLEPKKAGALAFALSFSNCGFIGFPVVSSILGSDALFLTSIHNIPFNVLAFTVGILIMAGIGGRGNQPGTPRIPLSNLLNINVIAAIVGFALFVASVTLPRIVALPLEMVASLTTPLAMIVTGAMLARTPIRSVVGDWKLYAVTLLRLAVWPLLAAVVLRLAGITGDLAYITIIIAGIPSASNTSLIAEVYGGDTDTASSIVFMTTLFSVISIPLMAAMLV